MVIKLSYNLNQNKVINKYFLETYMERLMISSFVVASYIIYLFIDSLDFVKGQNIITIGIFFSMIFIFYFIFIYKVLMRFFIEQTFECFENYNNIYLDMKDEYLILNRDIIEEKLYWKDIKKIEFSKDYIVMKYKTETIFISKGEDTEKFRDFENYVKEHYMANKS